MNASQSTPLTRIASFVLDRADALPLAARARMYQDLTMVIGDENESRQLTRMANGLLKADRDCREFKFSFSQIKTSKPQETACQ